MIAKIGQIVPPKVEKKADVSKTEQDENFSKVLDETSKEAEKSEKTQKQTSEKGKKAEKDEKSTQQEGTQKVVVSETNAQVVNQPVQENAVLNLAVEMVQTAKAEVNQVDSKLVENAVPVEVKVSAMPSENLKQSITVGEMSAQKASDNTQNTKSLEPIETEKQISDIEVNPQTETSAKSEVNIKQANVTSVQTVKSEIQVETDQKSEQTEIKFEPQTLEKPTQKPDDVNTKVKVESAQEVTVAKSDETNDKFEVSDIPVAKEQPQVISEIVDKVFAKEDVQTKEVIKQVLNKIDDNIKLKQSEFSFDLHPKDLGKIAVKMVVKSGMLVVDLVASSEKAQSILANNAGEIQSILEAQLSKQTNFVLATQNSNTSDYLQQQKQNHSSQQQQSQQQNNQQRSDSNENFTEDFMSMMNLVSQFKF